MKLNITARLTKVDKEQRLVYGLATAESVDRSGEILDYASSKPNFEKWVQESQDASEGQSFGNVRAMHGKVAAGKLVKIEFDDDNRQIPVCAKIVDDNEWNKVLEGVYTGFSIGGAYAKKWDDPSMKKSDGKPVVRYTAAPGELSLVDRPCLKDARFFDIQKADGAVEQAQFQVVVTDEQVEAKARELCKEDGGDPDITDTTDGKNEPLWKSYSAKAEDLLLKTESDDAAATTEPPAASAKTEANAGEGGGDAAKAGEGEGEGEGDAAKADGTVTEYLVTGSDDDIAKLAEFMHKRSLDVPAVILVLGNHFTKADELAAVNAALEGGTLSKGMWQVGRLADAIENLSGLAQSIAAEEQREGDVNSVLPGKSKALLSVAVDLLNAMVTEETAELLAALPSEPTVEVMAMGDFFGSLKKIGARNSKMDTDRIQKAHDLLAELGGVCAAAKADTSATADSMQKMVSDALVPLQKMVSEQAELIKKLSAAPAPAKGVLRALNKSDDNGNAASAAETEAVAPVLNKDGGVDAPATLIKMVHQLGGVRMGLRPDGSPV
jgi:hypothetical protein